MILDNSRITIRELADDVGISFGTCQAIFMAVLDMKRAATKIVPKLKNFEQKQHRMDIAQDMLTTIKPNGSVQKNQDRKKHVKLVQM